MANLDSSEALQPLDQLVLGLHAELAVDRLEMVANGVSADEEPLRDAGNAVPGPDVEQDFSLARRELLEIRVIGGNRSRRERARGDPEELEFPRDPVDRSAEIVACTIACLLGGLDRSKICDHGDLALEFAALADHPVRY